MFHGLNNNIVVHFIKSVKYTSVKMCYVVTFFCIPKQEEGDKYCDCDITVENNARTLYF